MLEVNDARRKTLWGNWELGDMIGRGSYGNVYKAYKNVFGTTYVSAVKHLTFPTSEQIRTYRMSTSGSEQDVAELAEDLLRTFQREIDILYSMKGNSNIVSHEDHEIEKRPDNTGYDIYIRMEYLTSFRQWQLENDLLLEDIVALGIDICAALELSHARGILHRDIKEENIFITRDKRFKLGDFGVATMVGEGQQASTRVGTPMLMAPEVYAGKAYGEASDIYLIGFVMYRLLNEGRLPFLPPIPIKVRMSDVEKAQGRRHAGEALPPPRYAQDRLGAIVLKACAFDPLSRYETVSQMKRELEQYLSQLSPEDGERKVMSSGQQKPLLDAAEEATLKLYGSSTEPTDLPDTDDQRHLYTVQATKAKPATIIYLIDTSYSMTLPLGEKQRIEVVTSALTAAIRQMVFRSTKGSRLSPRYRIGIIAYNDDVTDLLGGVIGIDQLAQRGIPELTPAGFSDAAKAFAYVEELLEAELPNMEGCPAPLICHMTDGASTDDPEPIVRRIMEMGVQDGKVLIENIFISDSFVDGTLSDPKQWKGITSSSMMHDPYAQKLQRMSSPLPFSYRAMMSEAAYSIVPDALMMLPGHSSELVSLGFQMSASTPIR